MTNIEDKRDAIFKATLALIAENGFHGTSMSQIAKKAGVSIGIIYHYFENKTELVNSLYTKLTSDYAQYVVTRIPVGVSMEDKLRGLFAHVLQYYIAHSDDLSFIEQYENSPFIIESTREEKHNHLAPIVQLFELARKEIKLKDVPEDVLIVMSLGAVVSLAKFYTSNYIFPDNVVILNQLEAILDMIRAH